MIDALKTGSQTAVLLRILKNSVTITAPVSSNLTVELSHGYGDNIQFGQL